MIKKPSTEPKRRRVARACDLCRSKKVKCDGRQPCIHCTVYSFRCTYDEPNIRNKKNTGIPKPSQPSLAALQVAAAQAAANGLLYDQQGINQTSSSSSNAPNGISVDTFPTKNLIIAQQIISTLLPKLQFNCFDQNLKFDLERFQKAVNYVEQKPSILPQTMNEVSDLMLEKDTIIPTPRQSSTGSTSEDSTMPASPSEIKLLLPSKEEALQLIYTTWYKACVLFRFYHRPSLIEEIDLLYSMDPSQYGDRQHKFLPFLYSSLACGCLFSKTPYETSRYNENLEDDGFKYFLEARKLIDISNVGDINSIQTIIMMIMYLQCSARLSTCYSYIGIALRSALKEGLHRNLSIFQSSKKKLDPIEIDTRKRLFFTIYKMDIYINSLLGLPRSLTEDEFDQELPVELDDENITRQGYLFEKQEGKLSSAGCANHHTKLMLILSHILKKLYPVKVNDVNDELISSSNNYSSDKIHAKVTELEVELKQWLNNLPPELQPTNPNSEKIDVPKKYILANCYLHLAFLNCQIMVYRPFIHFISDSMNGNSSDPRSLIRGRNCIKIARMVVKLANKMIDQKLLIGTYWFSMYTTFFSIACLIYYYHFANYNNNGLGINAAGVLFDDDLNIDVIRKDIEIGKKVLDCLKNSSNSSLRIYNILNTLFDQLNRRTASRSLKKSGNQKSPNSIQKSPRSNQSSPHSNQKQEDQQQLQQQPQEQQQQQQVAISSSFMNDDVKDTFKNFDDNNHYSQTTKKEDLGQLFSNSNIVRFQSTSDIPPEITNIAKLSIIKEEENQEVGSKVGADLTANYMPGVFDKLDAQIFGKILPPYMLKNNGNNQQQQQPLPQQQQDFQQPALQTQQLPNEIQNIYNNNANLQPQPDQYNLNNQNTSNYDNSNKTNVPTNSEDLINFDEIFNSLNNEFTTNQFDYSPPF
ncbi:ASG1 [Candida pseudojiufengensis]|uniref:ASG1 n=1 Tax=Candida pseudojiufengensis TaxID=497109 RepID=UPI002224D2B7|nr:ASG1 [Candida pseudojiufengensis]KAI5966841.1 ASG1 [Candida pseudojiufengensis]